MWNRLNDYFTFSKSERRGILFLVVATVLALLAPSVYRYFMPVQTIDTSPVEKEVSAFMEEYKAKTQLALSDTLPNDTADANEFNPFAGIELSAPFKNKVKPAVQYFEFDPNKIGEEEWIKLGFSQKQAESIEKLKAKGFIFKKPEDLKRAYVIGEENYNRLFPYIKIEISRLPKKEFSKYEYTKNTAEKFSIDINTADSSLFEMQTGIGPSLASRIIRYRERLGGFVSTEQIKEVWNFPDSTYQRLKNRFKVNNVSPTKINMNMADFKLLGKHPYINYGNAKVIIAYRKQHGNFNVIEDLKNVSIISDSIYQKLLPYITVE